MSVNVRAVCLRSSTEDCLVLICCGLYDLLRGVLLLLPDLMLEEVMDKLIQPDALIVLVNHSSPLIQQGVMKVENRFMSDIHTHSTCLPKQLTASGAVR